MKFFGLLVVSALTPFVVAQPVRQMSHKISPSVAGKVAMKKYPGHLEKTPRLEKEDGRWQYEVFIRAGKQVREINVDAETGKITSVEKVSAAEEAKEGKEKG